MQTIKIKCLSSKISWIQVKYIVYVILVPLSTNAEYSLAQLLHHKQRLSNNNHKNFTILLFNKYGSVQELRSTSMLFRYFWFRCLWDIRQEKTFIWRSHYIINLWKCLVWSKFVCYSQVLFGLVWSSLVWFWFGFVNPQTNKLKR